MHTDQVSEILCGCCPQLAGFAVDVTDQTPTEAGMKVFDSNGVRHQANGTVGRLRSFLGRLGDPGPPPRKALNFGVLPDSQRFLLELQPTV
jgi:hypothetical protein